MKVMDDLKEVLEDQLKKIAKKGDITPAELDSVYKATKTMKYMDELKQSEESGGEMGMMSNRGGRGGYSQNYSTHMPMGGMDMLYGPIWNRNRTYPDSYDGGSYDDNSRDGRGRGSYDGSYGRGSYDGTSNRGSYDGSYDGMSNDGRRGRDGDSDGRYSEEGSFRRGRDARGRYTSRDGGSYDYSRASKEEMVKKLEAMMQEAPSEKERSAIEQCLNKLEG